MSHAQAYSRLVFPDTVRVFGVALQPVTIGHGLILWRIESPFIVGGKAEARHIVAALLALRCKTARDADRLLNSWRGRLLIRCWGKQVKRLSVVTKTLAEAQIRNHVRGAYDGPSLWGRDEEATKNRCSAPYLTILKVRLMDYLHLSPEAALDYPIGQAVWDLACYAEYRGSMSWMSEEDSDVISELKRRANAA